MRAKLTICALYFMQIIMICLPNTEAIPLSLKSTGNIKELIQQNIVAYTNDIDEASDDILNKIEDELDFPIAPPA